MFESSKKDVLSSFQLDPELTEPHRLIKHVSYLNKCILTMEGSDTSHSIDSTISSAAA